MKLEWAHMKMSNIQMHLKRVSKYFCCHFFYIVTEVLKIYSIIKFRRNLIIRTSQTPKKTLDDFCRVSASSNVVVDRNNFSLNVIDITECIVCRVKLLTAVIGLTPLVWVYCIVIWHINRFSFISRRERSTCSPLIFCLFPDLRLEYIILY